MGNTENVETKVGFFRPLEGYSFKDHHETNPKEIVYLFEPPLREGKVYPWGEFLEILAHLQADS
jgi:hypothetical protein